MYWYFVRNHKVQFFILLFNCNLLWFSAVFSCIGILWEITKSREFLSSPSSVLCHDPLLPPHLLMFCEDSPSPERFYPPFHQYFVTILCYLHMYWYFERNHKVQTDFILYFIIIFLWFCTACSFIDVLYGITKIRQFYIPLHHYFVQILYWLPMYWCFVRNQQVQTDLLK